MRYYPPDYWQNGQEICILLQAFNGGFGMKGLGSEESESGTAEHSEAESLVHLIESRSQVIRPSAQHTSQALERGLEQILQFACS